MQLRIFELTVRNNDTTRGLFVYAEGLFKAGAKIIIIIISCGRIIDVKNILRGGDLRRFWFLSKSSKRCGTKS